MRKYEVRKKKRERNEAIHYNTPPAPMKEEERHFLETIATVVSKSNFLTLSFFLYYLVLKYQGNIPFFPITHKISASFLILFYQLLKSTYFDGLVQSDLITGFSFKQSSASFQHRVHLSKNLPHFLVQHVILVFPDIFWAAPSTSWSQNFHYKKDCAWNADFPQQILEIHIYSCMHI